MRLPIGLLLIASLELLLFMTWDAAIPAAGTVSSQDAKCPETEALAHSISAARASLVSTNARVNQPITLSFRAPETSISPDQPLYFVVLLPEEVRLTGTGFFGLAPGAPGPFGMSYGRERLRAVIPLHHPGSLRSVDIEIIPYRAGNMSVEWQVVAISPCGEDLLPATAGRGTLAVAPGIAELAPRDEFTTTAPLAEFKALKGAFSSKAYPQYVEVYDDRTGEMVLRVPGANPEFSPTGRFLIMTTPETEYYDVFDLIAIRKLGRFRAIGLYWSHADSFLYLDQPRDGELTIVRTLHGARHAPLEPLIAGISATSGPVPNSRAFEEDIVAAPGAASFVSGSEAWAVELSIEAGTVFLTNTWFESVGVEDENETTDASSANNGIQNMAFALDLRRSSTDPGTDKKDLAAVRRKYGLSGEPPDGWDVHDDLLQVASVGQPADEGWSPAATVTVETQTVKETKAQAPTPKDRPGIRRSAVAVDEEPFPMELNRRVAGAQLALLPAETLQHRRAGKTKGELAAIASELKALLPANIAAFGPDPYFGYMTPPFPDPSVKPEEVPTFDFDAPGRDLWAFDAGNGRHWLTHTAASGNVGIDYQFTLLSKAEPHGLRYADLLLQANGHFSKLVGRDLQETFRISNFGDARRELGSAFADPASVSIAANRYLTIATKPVPRLIAFDLEDWRIVCAIPNPANAANIADVALTTDLSHIVQINLSGQIEVYSCSDNSHVMSGLYVDGELVMVDKSGHFEGSDDAAEYIELKIPGLPGRHLLSQFTKSLRLDGLTKAILTGQKVEPSPALEPPSIVLRNGEGEDGGAFLVTAHAPRGLASIAAFADGRPSARYDVGGKTAEILVNGKDLGNGGIVTLVATDSSGVTSAPVEITVPRSKSGPSGKLFAVTVGIDRYLRIPDATLNYSVADANRIARLAGDAKLYRARDVKTLTDAEATSQTILSALRAAVTQATSEDTVLISFAGHGLIAEDKTLRMALTETTLEDLSGTSLALDDVLTVLKRSQARIILLLDVCHSGLANRSQVATNDATATRMLATESGAGIVILSASKGRQFSEETASLGGGRFSTAIESVLGKKREQSDSDGNGSISLRELYRAVKAEVVAGSDGRQTPWIARNQVFGDFDLF